MDGITAVRSGLAAGGDDLRIVEAVRDGDQETVRSLLEQQVDVNTSQPDGATALHWAAHRSDLETADLLIGAGANVNAMNDYGVTPLSLASTNGSAWMVEKLLRVGADPNAAQPFGETPLMTAARTGSVDVVRALLVHGARVNGKEKRRGQTALMWAVSENHPRVAGLLIEHGADVRGRSESGFTPLLFAARGGHLNSARLLLEAGANLNTTAPDGMSPLLMASASGHQDLSIFLLDQGADPNAADEYGTTALHYALQKGMSTLTRVELSYFNAYLYRPNMVELVKALLAHGADSNARLEKTQRFGNLGILVRLEGATPFLLAASVGDVGLMRVLINGGADPLQATHQNVTPLMVAAGLGRTWDRTKEEEKGTLEAVKLALELGSDVNGSSVNGRSSGIGVGRRRSVKLGLQPGNQGVGGGFIGSWHAGRWHGTGLDFAQHLFPHRGAFADFLYIHLIQHESCRAEFLVVTGDAEAIQDRSLGGAV